LVVHGGPGGGCPPSYRQHFDPKLWRIICVDQRGAGKSKPSACLIDNTTWHLVEDFETLRKKLSIDKWFLKGGSWGSTLSLAYATKHPEVIRGLILRGIFTLRRKELLFFYQEGTSFVFPDAFEKFEAVIPPAERCDMISAYHRRLTGDDEAVKRECALAWSIYEMSTAKLYVDPSYIQRAADDIEFALKFARIESHYFVHGGFFDGDNYLIDKAKEIRGKFPIFIVQGRYDMVCPTKTAWDLRSSLITKDNYFDFVIVSDAGHSNSEPGILSEIIKATDRFAKFE